MSIHTPKINLRKLSNLAMNLQSLKKLLSTQPLFFKAMQEVKLMTSTCLFKCKFSTFFSFSVPAKHVE